MWNRVVGQERVKSLLKSTIERGRIAHAYLFYGPDGAGMDAMAIEFARALNCDTQKPDSCGVCHSCKQFDTLQHPNLTLIFALPRAKDEREDKSPIEKLEEKDIRRIQQEIQKKAKNPYHTLEIPRASEIRINSIRDLRRNAALSPFARGRKVYIILDADRMNQEASNAFLKTLEEPTPQTALILTTSKMEKLRPTIVSRCQLVRFDPLKREEIRDALIERESISVEQAELIATVANGNFELALDLLQEDLKKSRDDVVSFLRYAVGNFPVELFELIERLSGARDRGLLKQWLSQMLLWLRDAATIHEGLLEGVVNVDQLETLERMEKRYPHADYIRAIESVERAIELVGRNVYLPLVLANLAYQLRDAIALGTEESIVKIQRS